MVPQAYSLGEGGGEGEDTFPTYVFVRGDKPLPG